ncbi:hypothetical protein MASR2M64_07200 [Candidatus Cloacimonadota bacterium]
MKKLCIIILSLSLFGSAFAINRGLVFLRALAVPGWSQVASGRSYGYAMLASEASIIGTMYYFNNEHDILLQDSYEYAIKFAHLNPADYDSKFYNNLSRYESSGFDANGYNAMIRQTAMSMYPYDPVAQQAYIDTNGYSEDKYWYWDAPSHRSQYNKMRNSSQNYEDYASVAVGVLILNHLVSGVEYLLFSSKEEHPSEVYFGIKDKKPMLFINYRW